jgi:lipoate-protein ligase A
MTTGHFVLDQPRNGLDNMAIDQAMLEQTALDSIVRVRFYRWIEPTVSLGYFQKFQEFLDNESTQGLPVVRRATGGGAIVHHDDWTYSIAIPAVVLGNHGSLGASSGLYDCVHQTVVQWLTSHGVPATLWSAKLTPPQEYGGGTCQSAIQGGSKAACPFLCFERRHEGDVIVQGGKVLGSAQRRHSGALLQHGSLLLSQSPYAPKLLGLRELDGAPKSLVLDDFSERILESIAQRYQIRLKRWTASVPLASPSNIVRQRLESQQWIGRI